MVRDTLRPSSTVPRYLTSDDRELLELLQGLAGEAGQRAAPEAFAEKLDRLGQLLVRHVITEEQQSRAAGLAVPCTQSHIQEHNLMLEQYVQWLFELMQMNFSPRAGICKKIEEWLNCHSFAPAMIAPGSGSGSDSDSDSGSDSDCEARPER